MKICKIIFVEMGVTMPVTCCENVIKNLTRMLYRLSTRRSLVQLVKVSCFLCGDQLFSTMILCLEKQSAELFLCFQISASFSINLLQAEEEKPGERSSVIASFNGGLASYSFNLKSFD